MLITPQIVLHATFTHHAEKCLTIALRAFRNGHTDCQKIWETRAANAERKADQLAKEF